MQASSPPERLRQLVLRKLSHPQLYQATLFVIIAAALNGCGLKLGRNTPDMPEIANVECTASIPFELCFLAQQRLSSQSTAVIKKSAIQQGDFSKTNRERIDPAEKVLLLKDYAVEHRTLSIRNDAATAEERLSVALSFELREQGEDAKTLVSGSVLRHSTFVSEESKLLAQQHEKAQTLSRLHRQLVDDIPWKLSETPSSQISSSQTPSSELQSTGSRSSQVESSEKPISKTSD